jgi:hypothetical protein
MIIYIYHYIYIQYTYISLFVFIFRISKREEHSDNTPFRSESAPWPHDLAEAAPFSRGSRIPFHVLRHRRVDAPLRLDDIG